MSQLLKQRAIAPRHPFGESDFRAGADNAAQIQDGLDDGFQVTVIASYDPAEDIGISGDRVCFHNLGKGCQISGKGCQRALLQLNMNEGKDGKSQCGMIELGGIVTNNSLSSQSVQPGLHGATSKS